LDESFRKRTWIRRFDFLSVCVHDAAPDWKKQIILYPPTYSIPAKKQSNFLDMPEKARLVSLQATFCSNFNASD